MNPFETKSVCTCPTTDANTLLEIQNYSAEAGFAKFDPFMVRMIAATTAKTQTIATAQANPNLAFIKYRGKTDWKS